MSSIPDYVDVIIVGTGLTNSILAAACSRIGKSVLHLDENSYYGNDWASFTFQQLIDWIKVKYPDDESLKNVPDELINKSRMFCIDLAPRFLFSDGDMVDLLVKSNVARYHEFKNNIRILCMIDDDLHVMPCRRNEVFTSPLLRNLTDKRRLMKFIELCIKYDQEDSSNDQSEISLCGDKAIGEYLRERGLRPDLREYIINSIAMVKPSEPMRDACKKIKKFMVATERYGKSPFLFPLYGCGEFPQSFCRLSAVFGGLYCLNTHIEYVKITEESSDLSISSDTEKSHTNKSKFSVKFSEEGHVVGSNMLVLEKAGAIDLNLIEKTSVSDLLSRAILITKDSIVTKGDPDTAPDLVSFLRIPPSDKNSNTVFLIELNSSSLVCPKDLNIVYLWTRASSENGEADLSPTVNRIFKDNCSSLIWKFYYQQLTGSQQAEQKELKSTGGDSVVDEKESNSGFYITSPACDDIDYTSVIKEAEHLFTKMCPGQEFLPRAPDPDEIIST